jgi:hypothetical protein
MFIDISAAVMQEAIRHGWDIVWRPYPKGIGGRLLRKGNRRGIYLPHIPVDPFSAVPRNTQIRDVFEALKKAIERLLKAGHVVGPIILQGGGTIPIPDWFRDFCRDNGISLVVLDGEDVGSVRSDRLFL